MQICKFFILFSFLMIYINADAQQFWIEQQCPTTKSLVRLVFKDTLNGWSAGDSGAILHTSNSGQNWIVQQSSITTPIEDLFFINLNTGFAISNDYSTAGSIVLKTTNGGINWSNSRFFDTTIFLRSIYYIDSLKGFLGAIKPESPVIYRTTNGGANWQQMTIHFSVCFDYPVLRFNFRNAMTGFACGGFFDAAGIVWQTTDGGLNWNDSCISSEPLFDVYPLNDTVIWAAGGDPEYGSYLYSSTNGGISWKGAAMNISGIPQRIAWRTPSEIWVPAGIFGRFALSVNAGITWLPIDLQDSIRVYDTHFVSPFSGWSVGNKGSNFTGVILKYNTSVIGIHNPQTGVPVSPVLYQNYPNPFNPETDICFQIPKDGIVRLVVYDILGKIIETLLDEYKQSGTYKVDFNGTNLASGVYFYRLDAGSFTSVKKMLIVK